MHLVCSSMGHWEGKASSLSAWPSESLPDSSQLCSHGPCHCSALPVSKAAGSMLSGVYPLAPGQLAGVQQAERNLPLGSSKVCF